MISRHFDSDYEAEKQAREEMRREPPQRQFPAIPEIQPFGNASVIAEDEPVLIEAEGWAVALRQEMDRLLECGLD